MLKVIKERVEVIKKFLTILAVAIVWDVVKLRQDFAGVLLILSGKVDRPQASKFPVRSAFSLFFMPSPPPHDRLISFPVAPELLYRGHGAVPICVNKHVKPSVRKGFKPLPVFGIK